MLAIDAKTPDQGVSDTLAAAGLTSREAAARLQQFGFNELPDTGQRGLRRIVADVLREPMFALLVTAAALYLLLGDIGEGLLLSAFAIFNVALVVMQERRTERVLDALRDLSSPRALVVRDGREQRIAGREVVPGDYLVLSEGDRVAADAVIVSLSDLHADESLLTGESVSVRKRSAAENEPYTGPGGDDTPFVFSGTMIVHGHGAAVVRATGRETEMGRIGATLEQLIPEPTLLQRSTGRMVRMMATAGVGVSISAVLLYGVLRGDWWSGMLAGITLAMSMLPEEIPMVLTVFLTLGAWRLSRHNVLTRRAAAVEMLGAVGVLCVDKTGTLTENRMTVTGLWNAATFYTVPRQATLLPEPFHEIVEFAILASKPKPYDPMELALHRLGDMGLAGTEHLHQDWTLSREYELQPGFLAMSQVWSERGSRADAFVVAAKGAPEAIIDLCHLPLEDAEHVLTAVQGMAEQGLRVIGVARGRHNGRSFPAEQHDFDFSLLGLVGLTDPLRAGVPQAVTLCRDAGIQVAMITGDYAATAEKIAAEAGIDMDGHTLTGADLSVLDDAALAERVRDVHVFARVLPAQKLRIVNALKAVGLVVGMTGDGVNDAPALKAAHIGIAMGGRGTDVAREAASLVLLDDRFESIVAAVRQGRLIFANVRKALAYIFAVHVPIAGLALVPLALGWPMLFFPAHIVFLEMVIDPVCSIVLEAEREEPDAMRRPPRRADAPLMTAVTLLISLVQGAAALAAILLLYGNALAAGASAEHARTLAFVALIVANLCLVLTGRSWQPRPLAGWLTPNPALLAVVATTAAALAVCVGVAPVARLFEFENVGTAQLAIAAATGFFCVVWIELLKPFAAGRLHAGPRAGGDCHGVCA